MGVLIPVSLENYKQVAEQISKYNDLPLCCIIRMGAMCFSLEDKQDYDTLVKMGAIPF